MTNKKISIAIPAHNEQESIQRTLKSILTSELHGLKPEVTICLSACTDHTEDRIKQFAKKFNKIGTLKTIECNIKGKARAIKLLDKTIKDDIIVFLDADCSPAKESIFKVYSGLKKARNQVKLVSGNVIDPRYVDKVTTPKSLIEAFNRTFWQRNGRKAVNGALYCIRKGIIQRIPDNITSEDSYLSIILWGKFICDSSAIIIAGSAQSIYELLRYQKQFQSAYKQIRSYLGNTHNFESIFHQFINQFDVELRNKDKYYPNIPFKYLISIKIIMIFSKIWGKVSTPTWDRTSSSKELTTN